MTPDPRAARGAAVLDRVHPGWADRIDLDVLDITRCDRCVLGQAITGEFGDNVEALFDALTEDEHAALYEYALDVGDDTMDALVEWLGLDLPGDYCALRHNALESAWHDLVNARRGGE